MAWATCVKCGKDVHWHGCRGARLADARCACGGCLIGKTAGRRGGGNTGRKMDACAVCGRRRFLLKRPDGPWLPRYLSCHPELARAGFGPGQALAAGAPCCSRHEPTPVDPLRHAYDESGDHPGWEDRRGVCAFCQRPKAEHERRPVAPGDADGKV